jgi:hypothetical protein
MKKYAEILEAITAARAGIVDTAKSEKDLARKAMLVARRSGTDAEFDAAEAEYKAAGEKFAAECQRNEDIEMTVEVLKDNAAHAFFSESIGTICNIWNTYAGKPRGEKTAEKIQKEMLAALGVRIWIDNNYNDARITCYFGRESKAPFQSLEFGTICANGEKVPALVDNKVQPLSADMFCVYNCGAYVDDVAAHVQAIREAHEKALEAEAALSNAVSAYNRLTRGRMAQASTRGGVNRRFIV